MEGVLWKWTNYMSGWQPRWFILESGILSYYKSQEDVNSGCKGSIKMSACDIKVHPTDHTRLDLIIPGEQHYYVKAARPQERQAWLIALGSAKAKYSQPSSQEAQSEMVGEKPADLMRTKKSELRLYCDLLMQQVHSVKESISQKDNGDQMSVPDIEKLNEATSLLSATCDTFIQTLESVMKLVHDTHAAGEPAMPQSPKRLSSSSLNSVASFSRSNSGDKQIRTRQSSSSIDGSNLVKTNHRRSRASSDGSYSDVPLLETNSSASTAVVVVKSVTPNAHSRDNKVDSGDLTGSSGLSDSSPFIARELSVPPKNSATNETQNETKELIPVVTHSLQNGQTEETECSEDFKDAVDSRIPTFFSAMKTSFVSLPLSHDGEVPVQLFLDACKELVPIFDKLNSTAFAPVKMDFSGNIRKLQQKQSSAIQAGRPGYKSLQAMVLSEVHSRQHTNSNSATVALRWLKRGLEFIRELLREVCSGSHDLAECASNAYARTLKNYHGWVVRGVFAVAVKALPYREEFLNHLASDDCDTSDPAFHLALMIDIEHFIRHLNDVILNINSFYADQQLDIQEQV